MVVNTAQSTIASVYNDFTVNGSRLKENERTERLVEFLEWFAKISKKKSVLLGDFNVNWTAEQNPMRKILNNWATDNGFEQIVTEPTRVVSDKKGKHSSQIDLSFVRGHSSKCKVIDPKISDHHAIVTTVSRSKVHTLGRKVSVTKFTPDIVKIARKTMPTFEIKQVGLTAAVSLTTKWCQDLVEKATTEKTVNVSGEANLFTPHLKALQTELFLSGGKSKTLQNRYVRELDKVKRASEAKMRTKNCNRGVWNIIKRKETNIEGIQLTKPDGTLTTSEKETADILAQTSRIKLTN